MNLDCLKERVGIETTPFHKSSNPLEERLQKAKYLRRVGSPGNYK